MNMSDLLHVIDWLGDGFDVFQAWSMKSIIALTSPFMSRTENVMG